MFSLLGDLAIQRKQYVVYSIHFRKWKKIVLCINLRTMSNSLEISIDPVDTMRSGKAGCYKHPKLFGSCDVCDHDNYAPWTVHFENYAIACHIVSLTLVIF